MPNFVKAISAITTRHLTSSLVTLFIVVATSLLLPGEAAALQVEKAADEQQEADVSSKLQQRAASYSRPVVIKFDGVIDMKNTLFIRNRIKQAKKYGADLLIIEIDSPGGLAIQSFEIAEQIRDIEWAYTVAYIPRQAISGAALISLGCDEIVLGSQARIGDAGPIEYDPTLHAFRDVEAKWKSVLVRQARDLAKSKGRSRELAESMIDQHAAVFVKKRKPDDKSELEFKIVYLRTDKDDPIDAAKKAQIDLNQWDLIEETSAQRILTLNGPRAVELGFANFIAEERGNISQELNVTGQYKEYEFSFVDSMVYWLSTPLVTGLLFVIGLIALYFELSAPGVGVGGLLAGLCASLFFWSRFSGGTSGWLEVILFLAGITFLVMEFFVIPGFGVAGFAGLVLLFVSVVMASQDFVIPQTSGQWSQTLNTLVVIVVSGCVFMIGATVITRKFGKLPLIGRLSLTPPSEDPVDTVDKETGKPIHGTHPLVSVGDWGVAETLLRPAGRASFGGQSIDVVSDGSFLEPGSQVRVVEIGGNRIVVAGVEDGDETVWKKNENSLD